MSRAGNRPTLIYVSNLDQLALIDLMPDATLNLSSAVLLHLASQSKKYLRGKHRTDSIDKHL